MPVGEIIGEGLQIHGIGNAKERAEIVTEMLAKVGLNPYHARRYPHEFSGGQRQRIGIARALALRPKFIVCDEPVSALDVSIQSQVLNLLKKLQAEFGLTYLFIAHNLSVVEHISDRIGVMYLGKMAEVTDREKLYRNPLHPYTQALLSRDPHAQSQAEARAHRVDGGCTFAPRPAQRLSLSPALSDRGGHLQAGGTGLRAEGGGPLGGLPPGAGLRCHREDRR